MRNSIIKKFSGGTEIIGSSFHALLVDKRKLHQKSPLSYKVWYNRFKEDRTMILYTSTRAFRVASYLLDLEWAYKEALPAVAVAA